MPVAQSTCRFSLLACLLNSMLYCASGVSGPSPRRPLPLQFGQPPDPGLQRGAHFFWPFSACQPHLCSPCGHPGQAGCAVNYDCTMTHSTSALLLMVLFFCCLSLVLEFLLSTLPQPVEETVLNQLKVLLA